MRKANILVYGTDWCGDCLRARRFLNQNQIPFDWINIDQDKEGEMLVYQINRGLRSVPTIIFPDGTILVEPTNLELAQKFAIPMNAPLKQFSR